ncbi:MAG: class I mannose-6-phosphate isomerase [Anaerolineae bacterium]|jgi:mannose-6-phosphate isomerase|nr:class I mannose-6-phosphate isomerase [Anaerolineae bacterium]
MYPLLLEPRLYVKVWGGRKLAHTLGKLLPTDDPYGESWELHDTSIVINGAWAGQTIGALTLTQGAALIGPHNNPQDGFPLLAKFLDAADWLSIQVHPDDHFAAQLEAQARGKTEAWYIIHAEPGARLVIGVKSGTTREQMASAIRENQLEDYLVYAEVNAGDVFYIPAGTIHAIGPGLTLYEIQQCSDTTYRLYDWGRMDLNGTPRPLHVDQALTVSNIAILPQITRDFVPDQPILQGPYFVTWREQLDQISRSFDTEGRRFHALTCLDGTVTITWSGGDPVSFNTGQTVLIPAALGTYTLSGTGQVLRSHQP